MSSLLDVLHKRPPRQEESGEAPAESPAELERPGAVADAPAADLKLAPDHEPVSGSTRLAGTAPRSLPAAPADEATVEMPRAAGDEPTQQFGATTQMRRWTDADPATEVPVPPPMTAAGRPAARSRMPFVLIVLGLLLVAVGLAAWRLATPPDDSFLAQSGAAPPAPVRPVAVEPVPAESELEPVVAPQPRRRTAMARVAADEAPAADADLVAWYDQPALPEEAAEPAVAPLIQITRGSAQNALFPKLREAYEALLAGDAARAETLYREVLAAQPTSVDALLGLASLASRGGRLQEAQDLYRSVQRLDPKNATATAALSALPGGAAPAATESQLKGMLREQPTAATLHFALGLRYVAEQRWPDAQAAFFEAVRHDPTNADYAFNLAVSLDRLGQAQHAASYYQRAIDLAAGSQQFDPAIARARLDALRGGQG